MEDNCACSGANEKAGSFANLEELYASDLFQRSKSRYAPGYEAHSLEANPRFKRIGADGVFRGTDDVRWPTAVRQSGLACRCRLT